jgi:hypothetical protein
MQIDGALRHFGAHSLIVEFVDIDFSPTVNA